jgi:hypothetical protein
MPVAVWAAADANTAVGKVGFGNHHAFLYCV